MADEPVITRTDGAGTALGSEGSQAKTYKDPNKSSINKGDLGAAARKAAEKRGGATEKPVTKEIKTSPSPAPSPSPSAAEEDSPLAAAAKRAKAKREGKVSNRKMSKRGKGFGRGC